MFIWISLNFLFQYHHLTTNLQRIECDNKLSTINAQTGVAGQQSVIDINIERPPTTNHRKQHYALIMCDYIACVYHLALSFGSNDDDDDNPEAVQRQRRELLKRNARARNIRAAILDFTACFDVDARAIERTHPEVHLKDSWTWISMGLADGRIQGVVLWQILWGATVAARALTKINNKRRIYTRR